MHECTSSKSSCLSLSWFRNFYSVRCISMLLWICVSCNARKKDPRFLNCTWVRTREGRKGCSTGRAQRTRIRCKELIILGSHLSVCLSWSPSLSSRGSTPRYLFLQNPEKSRRTRCVPLHELSRWYSTTSFDPVDIFERLKEGEELVLFHSSELFSIARYGTHRIISTFRFMQIFTSTIFYYI